jgi:hypothetical protein
MSNGEQPSFDEVVEHLTRFVKAKGPSTTPELVLELRTRFPRHLEDIFSAPHLPQTLRNAPLLSILDRIDGELLWGSEAGDDVPGVALSPTERVPLERAHFLHYRSLLDVALDLSPLTLLVGANGTGKSNVLDALFRVVRLERFRPDSVFYGPHAPERVRTQGYQGPVCGELFGEGHTLAWSWDKRHRCPDPHAHHAFGPALLLRLDSREVARPAYSPHPNARVTPRGYQVPAVLAELAATDPERFTSVQEAVRRVLPVVQGLRMPRRMASSPTGSEVMGNGLEAKIAGQWIPGDQLSEGTLLVIALQTILGGADRPRLLLLDDLDRGLHPAAQRRLIRQLTAATPDLTVVATTHSPFVLDEVPAESVRVVRLDGQGHTQVQPLTASPKWEEWKGSMTAGEFWVYAGEDWLESA